MHDDNNSHIGVKEHSTDDYKRLDPVSLCSGTNTIKVPFLFWRRKIRRLYVFPLDLLLFWAVCMWRSSACVRLRTEIGKHSGMGTPGKLPAAGGHTSSDWWALVCIGSTSPQVFSSFSLAASRYHLALYKNQQIPVTLGLMWSTIFLAVYAYGDRMRYQPSLSMQACKESTAVISAVAWTFFKDDDTAVARKCPDASKLSNSYITHTTY